MVAENDDESIFRPEAELTLFLACAPKKCPKH